MKPSWVLLLLGFAAGAAAQQSVADIESLLPAETFKMARSPLLSGRFVQTKSLEGLAQPLRSSGQFTYARDHGVLWQVQQPFAADYVLADGRLSVAGDGTPPAFGGEVARLLTALFTLDLEMLARSFELSVQRGKSDWSLRLTPRHRALSAALREVRLEGRSHLQRVSLLDEDGNTTRIELQRLRVLRTLPAEVLKKFQ
ncbi:MAG: outer membrane lipoprotein carrier protein LolA [Pseudomonadota bacterium]